MANISLQNIYKTYPGNVTAVHDFNLEIEDKEFIILVGPSGCGKSTTLRMIAGLEDISQGSLYIGDRLVNNVPPKDRDIAMVFQNYALYPHMSVYKNMAFGLELRKMPKEEIRQKVEEAAKILDIEELLDRKPKQLSGGQRQRVALGRAMVRNPKVFLLDEPLSNLDAKLRAAMRTEIAKLHKRLGTTFVYVTHDQVEAMTMGDRIIVMKGGFINQVGTPQDLYERPCNMFVAGFIGSPQMNFFDVTIAEANQNIVATLGDYKLSIPKSKNAKGELTSYVNKTIAMGIRPENISIHAPSDASSIAVDATVEIAELMGSETFLHLSLAGNNFVAKIPAHLNYDIGDKVKIFFDLEKSHFFDKETEKIICN